MLSTVFFFGFMVVLSLVAFLRQRTHFLGALLILELIAILLAIAVPLATVGVGQMGLASFLVILALSACEASLGLALLVFMVRVHGNDMIRSLSLHKV